MTNLAKEIPTSDFHVLKNDPQPGKKILVKLLNAINGFGLAYFLEDPNLTVDNFIKDAKLEFGKYAKNCDGVILMPYHLKLSNSAKMYNLVNDYDMVLLYEKDTFDDPEKGVIAILGEKIRTSLNFDYLQFLSYKELIEIAWYDPQELGKMLNFNEDTTMNLKLACHKELETRQRTRIMS